jgi:hypothetical protein
MDTPGFSLALASAVFVATAFWPAFFRVRQAMSSKDENPLLPNFVTLIIGLLVIVPLARAATRLGHELPLLTNWLRLVQRNRLSAPSWFSGLPFGSMGAAWWDAALNHPDGVGEVLHRLDRSQIAGVGLALWSGSAQRRRASRLRPADAVPSLT